MLKSRFIIGVALTLLIATALFYVGSIRYADVTNPWRHHMSGYPGYPPIGIVRWWSYISPIALGVGAAACLRRPLPKSVLWAVTVLSSVAMFALFRISLLDTDDSRLLGIQKFLWPGQSPPIDLQTFVGNIGLIGSSLSFAAYAITRSRTERRARRELEAFPQNEIARSLQPIMDPSLIHPSRFVISPMLRTRIISGLICALLIALPLCLVGAIRYQTHHSALVVAHTQSGVNFELPLFIRLLWPFGVVRWWSYITPLAIGVGIAARLRHSVSTFPLVISLLGTLVICAVAWQSFHLYAKMFSYMGYPASDPIEPEILWGNILAIGASLCFASVSMTKLIHIRNQLPANSGG